MKHTLFFISALCCAQPAIAQSISCHFTKECHIGKRCTTINRDVMFILDKEQKSYSIVADDFLEATGVMMDFDGKKGTLVSRQPEKNATYTYFYALSFSSKGAVVSRTGLDIDDVPDAVTVTGTCEVAG